MLTICLDTASKEACAETEPHTDTSVKLPCADHSTRIMTWRLEWVTMYDLSEASMCRPLHQDCDRLEVNDNGRKFGWVWQVLGNIKIIIKNVKIWASTTRKHRDPISPPTCKQWMGFIKRNFAIDTLFKTLTWTAKSWSLYLKAEYLCLFLF